MAKKISREEYELLKQLEGDRFAGYKKIGKSVGTTTKKGLTNKVKQTSKKKVSDNILKAINIVSPKGSILGKTTSSSKGKKSGGGRGRPSGTYKTRYLPSGRAVKVPTAVYKKMLSVEKAQIRLANAQRQALLQAQADQEAMQYDRRFQRSGDEEQFLSEPDMEHEQNIERARQQIEYQQMMQQQIPIQQPKQNIIQRLVGGINNVGRSVQQMQRPTYDSFGRPVQRNLYPVGNIQNQSYPNRNLNFVSDKSSILNTPNIFNRPRRYVQIQ